VIAWENHLPVQHLFAIDPRIQGAAPPQPRYELRLAFMEDEFPRNRMGSRSAGWFLARPSVHAIRTINRPQRSGITIGGRDFAIERVCRAVGPLPLRDDEERKAANPASDYEIPLILRDCTLDDHGQLVYATTFDDGQMPPPGTWAPECLGELPLVNGALYPYLEVEPRAYRFRVVNAANQRFFELFLTSPKTRFRCRRWSTSSRSADGGLLPSRVALHKLLLAPGERADLLVDFSGYAGKTVTLSNGAAAPFRAGTWCTPIMPRCTS